MPALLHYIEIIVMVIMSSKVSNRAMEVWLSRAKQREQRILGANIGLFVFSISALNPITQVLWNQFALDSSLRAVSSSTLAMISALSAFAVFVSLLIMSAIAGIFLKTEINGGNDFDFISKREFKYKLLSLKTLLSLNSTAIHKNLFNDRVIYEIAENKEYFIGDFVFGVNSKLRIGVFFVGMLIINSFLGWLLDTYSFGFILIHAISTAGLLILTEFWFGFFYQFKNRNRLQKVVADTGDSRAWCEYDLDIKSFNPSYSQLSWISKEDLVLRSLTKQAQNADAQTKRTLLALQLLSDNAYAAINTLNNTSIKFTISSDEEKYTNDSRKLKTVIDGYVPACIEKIKDSFDSTNNMKVFDIKDAHEPTPTSESDSRLSVAYKELYNDIIAQDELVRSIQSYYLDRIENSVLISFRDVIEKRASGWIDTEEDVYSLKTSVINESINKRVIPKLELLLIDANEEDAVKLKSKIAEFKEFFRKQVAIDEQENLAKQITYERDVDISIDDNKVPKRSVIEQEIMNADFYLQQLKREW